MSTDTWLTQKQFDRLTAELEELSTTGRVEIAKKIEVAREEGDLKENGGYHAAKEEQGKMEARIRQLTQLLRHAEVGAAADTHGTVAVGTVVTAKLAGSDAKFLLGSREMAAGTDIDVYSEQSPLGAALLGARTGDTREFTAPNGRTISVTVEAVEAYTGD